jgi:hypothetical protein
MNEKQEAPGNRATMVEAMRASILEQDRLLEDVENSDPLDLDAVHDIALASEQVRKHADAILGKGQAEHWQDILRDTFSPDGIRELALAVLRRLQARPDTLGQSERAQLTWFRDLLFRMGNPNQDGKEVR